MPPRRSPSYNTLNPQDQLAAPVNPSSATLLSPRSVSPSSGLTQFLSRPSKWFSRSTSVPKMASGVVESRSSTSSTGRKHKISHPTDPRPILDSYSGPGSKSVLDLSVRPPNNSLDISPFNSPSASSTPSSAGLGDLRTISRRGWSKSADDLGKVSATTFTPINTSFQEKVAQYRNRSDSGASGMSPSTPSSPVSISRQPFPSMKNATPSSSPPDSISRPSGVSISVSGPAIEDPSAQGKPQSLHVHTRSHSFTPKLSSKLATPRFGPPSPSRKGSGSDLDIDRDDGERPSPASSISPRGGFPFNLGGNSRAPPSDHVVEIFTPTSAAAARSTAFLSPPTIVEPLEDGDDMSRAKRSSQIVYHSGLINRMSESSTPFHHAHLSSSKSWKPFKLELKGSKLYFYKPPGDKSAFIKELFPTEVIPPSQQDDDSELDDGEASGHRKVQHAKRGEEGALGRKKRAFWGRKTHPDLVLDAQGDVERGSFEALVHEAVFATTFLSSSSNTEKEAAGKPCEEWRDFASSILLCMPSLVGRSKFETEFRRCSSYLISGVEDTVKNEERSRVGWLASAYLRFHMRPVDLAAWQDWRNECIPEVDLAATERDLNPGMSVSSSMQALYAPSPTLGQTSPDLGTFSPRPDGGAKLMSVMEVFGQEGGSPSPRKTSVDLRTLEKQSMRPPFPASSGIHWDALEREGLSRDVLLSLDPFLVARSLTLFHRSALEQIPDDLPAELIIDSENDTIDTRHSSHASLFGSEQKPHWLTKLLLMQILGADTSGGYAATPLPPGTRASEDRNIHTSRTHSRSEVISVWARVGELCRSAGDECSWRAIEAALCSHPVARLDKAWKRVDPLALAAIEAWVYPGLDGERANVKEPRCTPWGGSAKSSIEEELTKAQSEANEDSWEVQPLTRAYHLFQSCRTAFSLCPRRAVTADEEGGEDVRRMMTYWRDVSAEGGGSGGLASKFVRVDQFMSLSLAAEPRRKGLFEPYHWSKSLSSPPHASLIPLFFPEPLPTVTLIDRAQLVRTRIDSDAPELQFLRAVDAPLRQDSNLLHSDRLGGRDASGVFRGGTVIPVFNGDLLLVVQSGGETSPGSRPSSRPPSRPPSSVIEQGGEKILARAPSIRVKPGASQGLDRKTSLARRSSLPSISPKTTFAVSEPSSEPPLRVLVQAGTLSSLVKILVHGLHNVSVSVADDNGEMSLREGKTRDLVVDHNEFSMVWWNVFRSFVTPLVFFELLRKLYINAQPQGSSPPVAEYLNVASTRSSVLQTINEWLYTGGGAQDALDDPQLFSAIHAFLTSSTDHLVHKASNFDNAEVKQGWDALSKSKEVVMSIFSSQTMRPRKIGVNTLPVKNASRVPEVFGREPPDLDHIDPEQLVDSLDAMACAAYSNLNEEDMFVTADLLEVQSVDRTGWFLSREPLLVEDGLDIQTMYSHIQEVAPSSFISELTQDAIYRLLPPSIRSCIRAYMIIRKWLVSTIVGPRLGLRTRQTRMDTLLCAIEVCRIRTGAPSARLAEEPCIRSFVEAVITSAVLSPESRLHHRAWQNVAANRGTQCDMLSSLLSKPSVQSTSSKEPLAVDMGWIIERMLEIIATSDVVEPANADGQHLVNFDKRRRLCNLITTTPSLYHQRRNHDREDWNRRGYERLNNLEREVQLLQFDIRGIKDEAQREAAQAVVVGSASARKTVRPFSRLVALQLEKNRRDKNLRSRLQKEKVQEQARSEKRDDLFNKAMRPRKASTPAHKQHRNKKSMSAFLHFMRPISSAFGAEINAHTSGPKKTAAELDFVPSGKPSLVLSLVDARVAQFVNNERSFTFQLDTEDGGHYLFQAMNKRDMSKWTDTINQATQKAAKRRLTYLGSPKPQLSDHIHSHSVTASRDPTAVFGVELQFLLRREIGGEDVPPGTLPRVIERCLEEIETRGLTEVGIYRIAGASSEINALKDAFNRGESPIRRSTDIHAVCDLVKTWLRVLPDPVFPSSSYYEIIEAMKLDNLDARLFKIRGVVQSLPQANFDLLKRVSEHLDKVTDYEEHNQMTAEALAIVFSPNLLRAPQNDFAMILANMGQTHRLVKALITHLHVIFDDVDADGEADQDDDDYDSPILEEDEDEVNQFTDEPEHMDTQTRT